MQSATMACMSLSPAPRPRQIRLASSGIEAAIMGDEAVGGWALWLGDVEQSHVDIEDPSVIRHEYLRRMATVLDTLRPVGTSISVLHLGAGALTLPRYVQHTRPGSAQTVIEIERELVDFVTSTLPLPPGTRLHALHGDAREVCATLPDGTFDAVVMDLFTGEESPDHLACTAFYTDLLRLLHTDGALLINVGDHPPLRFAGTQIQTLDDACAATGLAGPWVLADASMLTGRYPGNLVLAAGGALNGTAADTQRAAWEAAGPHPAAVLDPHAARGFAAERVAG